MSYEILGYTICSKIYKHAFTAQLSCTVVFEFTKADFLITWLD